MPQAYEQCPACQGSTMAMNHAGEPCICGVCHGDSVVVAREPNGRFKAPGVPPQASFPFMAIAKREGLRYGLILTLADCMLPDRHPGWHVRALAELTGLAGGRLSNPLDRSDWIIALLVEIRNEVKNQRLWRVTTEVITHDRQVA